jgi:O-antigen/teichoic acid export membrane protein
MRNRLVDLFRPGFVRSASVLVGGTVIAQSLMLLILPVLTRLYTPGDFSALAVYVSILGITSVAACMRLEIAIPLPQSDEDAANLLALALCSSAGVAGLSALIVAMFPGQIVVLISQPPMLHYLWLLPLGIWLSSSYAALQFWAIRKKRFAIVSKTRVGQAFGGASAQVGLGLAGNAPLGLLLGQLVSSGAGLFGLVKDALKNDRTAINAISLVSMRRTLKEYKRFPKFSTFESLANSASIQLPVIFIAAMAIGPEAGYLLLASRVLFAPMTLIGGAVSQVYISRAPDELRAGTLGEFTVKIIGGLAKTGVGPMIFIGILAPIVFPLIFGAHWQRAGNLVLWLTPWCVMQFLAVPISMALHVKDQQRTALLLQIVGLIARVGSIIVAGYLQPGWLVETYALSGFFFYMLYFGVIISMVKTLGIWQAICPGVVIILIWIAFAVLLRFVVERAI